MLAFKWNIKSKYIIKIISQFDTITNLKVVKSFDKLCLLLHILSNNSLTNPTQRKFKIFHGILQLFLTIVRLVISIRLN